MSEEVPKNEHWYAQVAEIEARLGFKICGARNRKGTPCSNIVGKGTDALGVEGIRCKNHGGRNQSPLAKNWKHGKLAKVTTSHPVLREKMEELAADHDVFSLEEEILKMRAITEILAENEDFLNVSKNIVDLSKVIERLHNIQVGRKYYISVENVSNIIEYVKEVIFRHVPEEHRRHLIAQDLNSYKLGGRPAPRMIEGTVIDAE